MYIIVGLGNPTKDYEHTRHNVGFDAIEELIRKYEIPYSGMKHKALYGKGRIDTTPVIIAKPVTYMNLSGESVRALVDYYKINPEEELIVIYDDINLSPGELRLRKKGSAGGHNGIKSIINHLGTNQFMRIKIGVGDKPAGWNLTDYVLGHFSKEEQKLVDGANKDCVDAVAMILSQGMDPAMNTYNRKHN
jgi:PTH1 family peptidyl-tRNA hydrolase